MSNIMDNKLPENLHRFFWEYDPDAICINEHSHLIMWRLMERGTWEAMLWLRKTFSNEQIVDFLHRKGKNVLSARELNYWSVISGVADEKRREWLAERKSTEDIWMNRSAH